MVSRRDFFLRAGAAGLAAGAVSRVSLAALPDAPTMDKPGTHGPLVPSAGRPYNPVVT